MNPTQAVLLVSAGCVSLRPQNPPAKLGAPLCSASLTPAVPFQPLVKVAELISIIKSVLIQDTLILSPTIRFRASADPKAGFPTSAALESPEESIHGTTLESH